MWLPSATTELTKKTGRRRSWRGPTPTTGSAGGGKIEFDIGANLVRAFDAAAQNIPILAIAALFQKDLSY
jgi:hypothetical protein